MTFYLTLSVAMTPEGHLPRGTKGYYHWVERAKRAFEVLFPNLETQVYTFNGSQNQGLSDAKCCPCEDCNHYTEFGSNFLRPGLQLSLETNYSVNYWWNLLTDACLSPGTYWTAFGGWPPAEGYQWHSIPQPPQDAPSTHAATSRLSSPQASNLPLTRQMLWSQHSFLTQKALPWLVRATFWSLWPSMSPQSSQFSPHDHCRTPTVHPLLGPAYKPQSHLCQAPAQHITDVHLITAEGDGLHTLSRTHPCPRPKTSSRNWPRKQAEWSLQTRGMERSPRL